MPHSDLHKKKKSKNLFILALILGFMAMIWMITMIKIARADEGYNPADYEGLKAKRAVDNVTSYLETREAHLQSQIGVAEHWWYDELVPGTAFDMGGRRVDNAGNDMKTTLPVKLDNERRLHNTFDHNRSVGGISTITQ